MVNGMYSVSFEGTKGGSGAGVAAVRDDEIHGGDAGYGYLGTFRSDGQNITASLRVLRHNQATISVFGPLNDFRLELTGTAAEDRFTLSGGIPNQPGMTITIRGRKFAELTVR